MEITIPKDDVALFKGEVPVKVVLPDGESITVLRRKSCGIYCTPGRSANFGGVAGTRSPDLHHFFLPLKNGKSMQLFVNETSGLVCVDVINERGTGGCEHVRMTIEEIKA